MKRLFTKGKLLIIGILIGGGVFLSSSFTDNYFEIAKNLDIFATLFRELNISYVDETNPGELMKIGIDNMLASLDPYTSYIPESQVEDYKYMQTGEYGGIGALIRQDSNYVVISEPYEGYPAQKAGLLAGDKLLKVNTFDLKGKSTEEVSKFLKGQASTKITLLIEREGTKAPFEVELNREAIKINSVSYSGMITPEVGYIKLTGFTENASGEIKKALIELKKNKSFSGLVLDLRGNPGGLLNEAVSIVNLFVEKGTEVVSTRGKIKDKNQIYKALNVAIDNTIPIAVLIDESSASASEIVSGAIQDLDRGVVIGQRSYGKGLVQQTRPLSYNAHLKVTIAKYYIPSGRCIQALDYSHHNEDGSVNKMADSLKSAFKTKNGRTVYDGGGVTPDIKMEPMEYSSILKSLVYKNLIFNYATKYRIQHPSIVSAKEFKLTDTEYKDFVTYLTNKDYNYVTPVEKTLNDLSEQIKNDSVLAYLETDLKALQTKVHSYKKEDLMLYKTQIKEFLEEEIVSRYYYQNGRLEASFEQDAEINEAVMLLKNSIRYQMLLNPLVRK
jgi:carboxyl-terminal processing protease